MSDLSWQSEDNDAPKDDASLSISPLVSSIPLLVQCPSSRSRPAQHRLDHNLNLIKGMGGALLREKIVAMVSKREIIIADGSKEVNMLGTKSALPVEILPFALAAIKPKLEEICVEAILRERDGKTFVSDNGNYIIDCKFDAIAEPEELEFKLNNIPGVVENGLFLGLANLAILGTNDGLKILE